MTERPGGSDLSKTETKAWKHASTRQPSANIDSFGAEEWRIDGFKWFSSATDGDVALALARTGERQLAKGVLFELFEVQSS